MQNITNIIKSLVIAALLVALASQIAIAEANASSAESEACEANFLNTTDEEVVEIVNSLEDECRAQLEEEGNLPEAPSGYSYAEDLTIVPNSFYSNSKGGESPSSSKGSSRATVTSNTVAQAPKASDSSAMKKAKELAAKAKDRKSESKSKPSKTTTKPSESKNTAKSPSKSSESSKSCTAEDGSTIENCKDYYSPAPKTSDDGWLVLVWDKGTTNKCSYFTNDRAEADSVASQYQSSGKAAAVVHYTKSLATKSPSC